MSAERIDVLAVMDKAGCYAAGTFTIEQMRAARAAVAELIEAAEAIAGRAITHGDDGLYVAGGVSVSELRALRAALARIGGAA